MDPMLPASDQLATSHAFYLKRFYLCDRQQQQQHNSPRVSHTKPS